MANAHNQTAVAASVVDLFRSTKNGGSDIDNCTAFCVLNDGAGDLLLEVVPLHAAKTPTGSPAFRLASGKSVTFGIDESGNIFTPIQRIQAVRAASTSTTVSGGVVRVR